jgi:hypothetical protein
MCLQTKCHEYSPGSSGEGRSPHLFAPPHSPNTQPLPPLRHFHLPQHPPFSHCHLACIPWDCCVHATWFCHINTQAPPPFLFVCHIGHLRCSTPHQPPRPPPPPLAPRTQCYRAQNTTVLHQQVANRMCRSTADGTIIVHGFSRCRPSCACRWV